VKLQRFSNFEHLSDIFCVNSLSLHSYDLTKKLALLALELSSMSSELSVKLLYFGVHGSYDVL